jgi:hypothetical protein
MNELLQYLKERIESIDKKGDDRFDVLNGKIDSLIAFKWKITGGALAISVIVTLLFQIAMVLVRYKY